MKQIKNILFPMKFTDYSLSALEYAIAFARGLRSRLHLLHVITGQEAATFDELNEFFHTILDESEAGPGRSLLDQVDLVKVHVRDESVGTGIVRYAKDVKMDLILMASSSHSPDPPVSFAGTVRLVMGAGVCPVLILWEPESPSQHRSQFEMTLPEIRKEISSKRG